MWRTVSRGAVGKAYLARTNLSAGQTRPPTLNYMEKIAFVTNHSDFKKLSDREKLFLENFVISELGSDVDLLNFERDLKLYKFNNPLLTKIYWDSRK